MFFLRLKNFLLSFLAVVFFLCCLLCVYAFSSTKLSKLQGERMFFLNSASSQGLRKEKLSLQDLFRVKGECVRVKGELTAEEIFSLYGAKVCFVEKTSGFISYYCYTDRWADGLFLQGRKINLHIAVSECQMVVGTPIIFDGY